MRSSRKQVVSRWVREVMLRLWPDQPFEPARMIRRIEVHARSVQIAMDPAAFAATGREQRLLLDATSVRLHSDERLTEEGGLWWLHVPSRLQFRGGRAWVSGDGVRRAHRDDPLIRALRTAHRLHDVARGASGLIEQQPVSAHERNMVRLVFLAPDIQAAILTGRQPPELCLEDLRRRPIPLCWEGQRRVLMG